MEKSFRSKIIIIIIIIIIIKVSCCLTAWKADLIRDRWQVVKLIVCTVGYSIDKLVWFYSIYCKEKKKQQKRNFAFMVT